MALSIRFLCAALILVVATLRPCAPEILSESTRRSLQSSTQKSSSASKSIKASSSHSPKSASSSPTSRQSSKAKGSSKSASRKGKASKAKSGSSSRTAKSSKSLAANAMKPRSASKEAHVKPAAPTGARPTQTAVRPASGCMVAELSSSKARVGMNKNAPAFTRGILTITTVPLGPAYLLGRTTYNLYLMGLPSWLTGNLAFQIYNQQPYVFRNVGLSNGLWKHANCTDQVTGKIAPMLKLRDQMVLDAGKPVYAILMEDEKSGQYLAAGTFNYTVPCPSNITALG